MVGIIFAYQNSNILTSTPNFTCKSLKQIEIGAIQTFCIPRMLQQLPKSSYGRSLGYKQSKIHLLQRTPESTTPFILIYCTCTFTILFSAFCSPLALQLYSFLFKPLHVSHGILRRILIIIGQRFTTSPYRLHHIHLYLCFFYYIYA